MKKPSIEEVQAYIIEKNLNVDAQVFWLHYDAKGWKTKSGPMVRWHSSVALWGVQGWGKTGKSTSDYQKRNETAKSLKKQAAEKEQWRGSRYADYLRAKTKAALQDLLEDGGQEAQRNGWLIREIMNEAIE